MRKKIPYPFVPIFSILAFLGTLAHSSQKSVIPGIEVLLTEQPHLVQGKRVGLITNHTGVDRKLRHDIDVLRLMPGVKLVALFSPEHGIRGTAQAGEKVESEIEKKSGVPLYSLYGEVTKPTPEMMKEVEVLVYDIQDIGARYYTYISTLGQCMEAAAEKAIPFIVLDRPNPLSGLAIEGRILDLKFRSFVGAFAIPIRYGLTPGELAGYVKDELKLDLQLSVVRMKNWRRRQCYDETGLIWVPPSPNIPTLESAWVYPGMCLLEGTNLSEGRGTTKPFEMVGAPWIDGNELAERLNDLNLPGVLFRPVAFTPVFSKFSGQSCQGVQIHVINRSQFSSVRTALFVIQKIRDFHPSQFKWNEKHFDRLVGSDDVRQAIEHNVNVEKIIEPWQAALKDFESRRRKYFLYLKQ